MKYLSFIIILTAFLLQSCSPENSVAPEFDQPVAKTWIHVSEAAALQKTVTVENHLDGAAGGFVNYDLKVGNIYVSGNLTVPENSYDGLLDLSIEFSNQNTTQTFGPSPLSFNTPLILNLEYRGVNLKGVNPEEVDFYFIESNGTFYKAEYSSIEVDVTEGILRVNGARINHFSRYGWAK